MNKVVKQHIQWIDSAKFMAVLAVALNHSGGVLYQSANIENAMYYAVSMFVIVSGFLGYKSEKRHSGKWNDNFWRSVKEIVIAYIIASFLYYIKENRNFDFQGIIKGLLYFNISGQFYYVFLFIQLMLVRKPLYRIVSFYDNENGIIYECAIGIVLLFIASLTTKYSNIMNIYGAGGKLFGGTCIFLFYMGMIISKYDLLKPLNMKNSIICTSLAFVAWFVWWRFACLYKWSFDAFFPFGDGANPPSVTLMIMAFIMLYLWYGLFQFLNFFRGLRTICRVTAWLGEHTLYIFLYHSLFLNICINRITTDNALIKWIIFISSMLLGPIVIEFVVKRFIKKIVCLYS